MKFDDIFNIVDTIHQHDKTVGQTDTWTTAKTALTHSVAR